MELKELIGNRRSIRYFQPWRPVEKEKIQKMLEAARLASRAVNQAFFRAVVVYRDDLTPEQVEGLKTPTTTTDLDLAPVFIFWFLDPSAPLKGKESLRPLVDVGALNASHGWSYKYIDEVVYPTVLEPIVQTPEVALAVAGCEAGLAICQAMLVAYDEGLGVCMHGASPAMVNELVNPPEGLVHLWVMLVGYPAEDSKAGGQRPREPFEQDFFLGNFQTPFPRDEKVVEELKAAKMFQEPAPFPWRKAEVSALARMFGLPE